MKLDLEIVTTIWNGTDAEILARVYLRDANRNRVPAKASDISAIGWSNRHGGTGAEISSGTFDPAAVMLPEVSHGTIWEQDKKGFNFHAMLAADKLQATTNLVLVTFEAVGGRKAAVRYRLVVI